MIHRVNHASAVAVLLRCTTAHDTSSQCHRLHPGTLGRIQFDSSCVLQQGNHPMGRLTRPLYRVYEEGAVTAVQAHPHAWLRLLL
jgi:hypothetical protein